ASLVHAECFEDFRFLFGNREHFMASRALLRNRFSGIALVDVVVAAETAGKLIVAKVIGIYPPRNHHLRKDIAGIDVFHTLRRLVDRFFSCEREYGVTLGVGI